MGGSVVEPVTEPIITYEPTNWKSGDVITAEKLNKLGRQMTPLIIDITDTDTLGVSYKELRDAILSGRTVTIYNTTEYGDLELHAVEELDRWPNSCHVQLDCGEYNANSEVDILVKGR